MFDAATFVFRYFQYDHLPSHLKDASAPFYDVAHRIASSPVYDEDQREQALRRLLESKDAFVRSHIP